MKLELIEARKIWDRAPHNAFTDLVRFRGRWFCTFREGQGHVSPDGAVRVLASADGRSWEPAALLRSDTADLRDPKISLRPDGRLMLVAAAALHRPRGFTHQTLAWSSADGHDWCPPVPVGDPGYWLWRVTWSGPTAYSVGYHCSPPADVRLFRSSDGCAFGRAVPDLYDRGEPNETALVFRPDGTCLCLLRRDAGHGLLGRAVWPYTAWAWADVGVRIGGPNLIELPGGRLVAAVRLYDRKVRTALGTIDPDTGRFAEALALPSGGDSSYAGLAWHHGLLWVSYYSSHEGRTSIYLATVRVE